LIQPAGLLLSEAYPGREAAGIVVHRVRVLEDHLEDAAFRNIQHLADALADFLGGEVSAHLSGIRLP
jgi:hypothetical protein